MPIIEVGINCRAGPTYVTDGAGQTYFTHGDSYPTTRGGITFGMEDAGLDARDRTTSNDVRLAGYVYQSGGIGTRLLRVDLPVAGDYVIRIAVGDPTNSSADYGGDFGLTFRDGSTDLLVVGGAAGTGEFLDATSVSRTAAAWPGSNASSTLRFATTIFRVANTGTTASRNPLTHVQITEAVVDSDRTDNCNRTTTPPTLGTPSDGLAGYQTWIGDFGCDGANAYSDDAGECLATLDCGNASHEVAVEITDFGTGTQTGCAAGVVDVANYYLANVQTSTGAVSLFKKVANAYTSLGSGGTVVEGDVLTLIRDAGTGDLTVKVNGTTVIGPVADTALVTGTRGGFRSNGGAGALWSYLNVTQLSGPATYTATASLTAGGADVSSSATFVGTTYTATASLTAPEATATASATFSAGTKTATASLVVGEAVLSGAATFTASAYTASATLTVGEAVLSASATFTAPVYAATATLNVGEAVLSASATFVAPVYTASAALTVGEAVLTSSASVTPPSYTASASLAVTRATLSAVGIFATQVYSAFAPLTIGEAVAAASATFTAPTYTGSASLAMRRATLSAAATHAAPAYTGSSALTVGRATAASVAAFAPPTYTASAALSMRRATVTATATVTPPAYTATTSLLTGEVVLTAAGTMSAGVFTATAALAVGRGTFSAVATFTPGEVRVFVIPQYRFIGGGLF